MSLADDLSAEVKSIFAGHWSVRDGQVVPEANDVQLGNDAVNIDGAVLYADLSASTVLVDSNPSAFAAEIYKAYLHCAAKIIRAEGGKITSYDGDRIMAVYLGTSKNTCAARTGLKINWTVKNLINPLLKQHYPASNYAVKQTVGIDTSNLFVARTGIRGSNDLVWVGRAANHAAKLTTLSSDYPNRVTTETYKMLHESLKTTNGNPMWEAVNWNDMGGVTIYRSTWWWSIK